MTVTFVAVRPTGQHLPAWPESIWRNEQSCVVETRTGNSPSHLLSALSPARPAVSLRCSLAPPGLNLFPSENHILGINGNEISLLKDGLVYQKLFS